MTRNTTTSANTVLITGASSGIGEALAHCFAQAQYGVVLVARSEGKLKALAELLAQKYGVTTTVQAADLARPGAPADLQARLQRQKHSIDVLVNCAGVLEQGVFADMEPGSHQGMIDLNISALTGMLSAFLPGMVKQGQGRVLAVKPDCRPL